MQRSGEIYRMRRAALGGALALSLCMTHGSAESLGSSGCADGPVARYIGPSPGERVGEVSAGQLSEQYGVAIALSSDEWTIGDTVFGPLEEERHDEVASTLAATLRYVPPQLMQRLNLNGLRVVSDIYKADGSQVAGLYYKDRNEIIVAATQGDTWQRTLMHELMHAIDQQLLCSEHGQQQKDTWGRVALELYRYDEWAESSVEARYVLPHKERQFASQYGMRSASEDRASMLEHLLFERGLVQEGDPDFGSPFHVKQQLLVSQLEQLMPGVETALAERTPALRQSSTELTRSVPHPYEEGLLASPRAILSYAFVYSHEVEQLVGASVVVRHDGGSRRVHDPVVVRGQTGEVVGFAWTTSGEDGGVEVADAYFDSSVMDIVQSSAMPIVSVHGLIDSTSPTREGFLDGGLSVQGVPAGEFALTSGLKIAPGQE